MNKAKILIVDDNQDVLFALNLLRSEERRVGKECTSWV